MDWANEKEKEILQAKEEALKVAKARALKFSALQPRIQEDAEAVESASGDELASKESFRTAEETQGPGSAGDDGGASDTGDGP